MGFSTVSKGGGLIINNRSRELEEWAQAELEKWGLTDWSFKWDKAARRFGLCSYRTKTISVSNILALKQPNDDQFYDTVKHEIAHALAGSGAGHGIEWKRKCVEVGAKPERLYSEDVESVPHKYEGHCPNNCGTIVKRYRLKKASQTLACSRCCKRYNDGKYDARFLLVWWDVQ